ncbi:hypothetical protein [Chitinilyticum litopenaei]|uniref:hypothetical protein n=1 Tax=Chitinilyticum litopenaei TaxID=1121276 RepID=UPI0003F59926|nr:hypothetical protein [Chitinilyticum litopenaei]
MTYLSEESQAILQRYQLTSGQVLGWVSQHLGEPKTIFDAMQAFAIGPKALSEMLSDAGLPVSRSQVVDFFAGAGLAVDGLDKAIGNGEHNLIADLKASYEEHGAMIVVRKDLYSLKYDFSDGPHTLFVDSANVGSYTSVFTERPFLAGNTTTITGFGADDTITFHSKNVLVVDSPDGAIIVSVSGDGFNHGITVLGVHPQSASLAGFNDLPVGDLILS